MSTAARIEELRKKFDENPRRYFAPLANELRKAGELTQAIALCREHLPKQPGHMSGYIVFGQALYESGDLDEARAVFEQALALDPENLIALHHLGHIAKQVGDNGAARRWYERALETDPRNDDIAHQLAALATPIRAHAAVPTPGPSLPAVAPSVTPASSPAVHSDQELAFLDTGYVSTPREVDAIPTPPFAQDSIGTMPLAPTPDASMRAVDFDEVNGLLHRPEPPAPDEPIDLSFDDAASTAPLGHAAEPTAGEGVDAPVDENPIDLELPVATEPSGQALADDPFAFADDDVADPAFEEIAPVDLEAAFEEGLVTSWPDTSDFATRVATPRELTPVSVDITPDAAEAFGLEPEDEIRAVLPEPEPDVFDAEIDLVSSEPAAESVAPTPEPEMSPVPAAEEVDDVTSDADPQEALPWLAAPVTPSEDVTAIVHALEEDARALGEPDEVSIFAEPVATAATSDEAYEHASVEVSFSDVHPGDAEAMEATAVELPSNAGVEYEPESSFDEGDEADEGAGADAPETPAFVTETMGELLVAQGFIDRAVDVYEELVRRRPYDPVLSARLAELQELAATVAPVMVYTARERYAALAARRVARRTPSRAATPIASLVIAPPASTTPVRATPTVAAPVPVMEVTDDSLAALFGAEASTHDDFAARALADAFAPVPLDEARSPSFGKAFFGANESHRAPTPAYGAVRQPTPVAATPVASAPTPVAPRAISSPLESPAGRESAADFSFDRFFPDPAVTPGENPPGTPGSTPVVMPPSGQGLAGDEPSATDDLAQFSAWLKGLGNS
jgi:tetratricopeptide (TPR) repeat protein